MNHKKTAIVYDWLDSWGGIERVLLTFAEMLPDAHWYTSVFDETRAEWAEKLKPQTSFIQNLPSFVKHNRILSTALYPFAFESLDFSKYDLVISITSSFAKGIITHPSTEHICYLLTPSRFLWLYDDLYTTSKVVNFAGKARSHLKRWDKIASQRPDKIISISKAVQKRAKEIYNRTSDVLYPPFDTEYWERIKRHPELVSGSNEIPKRVRNDLPSNYYLLVSRLEPYKRVDLAIQAFNTTDRHLVIVGTGSQEIKLKAMANKNITFLKDISDPELLSLYANAQALILPQEEDFGLVAVEAQFFGCPVIAYGKGGALETIIENKTGLFFPEQTITSVHNALEKFEEIAYTLKESAKINGPHSAQRFSRSVFIKKFHSLIHIQ